MVEINPQALATVKAAFERYKAEVEASKLQQTSKDTYLLHTWHFIRWLEGDFTPGGTL